MPEPTITQSLLLDARTRCGWAGDRPRLSDEQMALLMARIGDRVPPARLNAVRWYIGQMFAKAVEDTLLLFQLRREAAEALGIGTGLPKLTTSLARQIEEFKQSTDTLGNWPVVTDGMRRVIIAAQFVKDKSIALADGARRIDALVDSAQSMTPEMRNLLDDVLMETQPGRDWSIMRQMVRGLAAMLEGIGGEIPKRSYISSERDKYDFGERGWFHNLCEQLAGQVHAALPAETRPERPSSVHGLVNDELKALRVEVPARQPSSASEN